MATPTPPPAPAPEAPASPDADTRFLAMLDDRESLLVYADSLEERGDPRRAEVLRLEYALRGDCTDEERAANAMRAIALARELVDPAWCAAIGRAPVLGSTWVGKSGDEEFIVRFLEGGAVNYHYGLGASSYQNATWIQVGLAVAIETNKHYADYEGALTIDGAGIVGQARNITGARWAWNVARTTDPAIVRIPDNVDMTVYDHAGPKTPTPAEPAPPAKRKAVKAKPEAKARSKARSKAKAKSKAKAPAKKAPAKKAPAKKAPAKAAKKPTRSKARPASSAKKPRAKK